MTQKIRFKNLESFGFGPNVMKKLRVCLRCGQMVKSKTNTCPNCGENLPKETLFDLYKHKHLSCPDCDTVLAPGSMYCPNCGKAVNHNDNAALTNEKKNHQMSTLVSL